MKKSYKVIGTFLAPYISAILSTTLLGWHIPQIEMTFDGLGGFVTFFVKFLNSFIATSLLAIMFVSAPLLMACFTFLIGKGKSFWDVAFILSIIISGMNLLLTIKDYLLI